MICNFTTFTGERSFHLNLIEDQVKFLTPQEIHLWIPSSWFTKNIKINGRRNTFYKNYIGESGNIFMPEPLCCVPRFKQCILNLDGFLGLNITKLVRRCLRKNRNLTIQNLREQYSLQYAFLDIPQTPQVSLTSLLTSFMVLDNFCPFCPLIVYSRRQ